MLPGTWARDLSGLAGELAALKADEDYWLTSPEYAVLHLRLENAHAAVEAALIEARRFGPEWSAARPYISEARGRCILESSSRGRTQ
jgi:hypothetical protein